MPAAAPMATPATVPEMMRGGKYSEIAAFSITRQAAIICPALWATPPATLTPTEEKLFSLPRRIIKARASAAPETLYNSETKLPKRSAESATRTSDTATADGYLVDQGGNWSAQAANDYMKTILSAYSESGGNMVELVIANNDEMALGAISALQEIGYNKAGGKTIPVFGVDATEAAIAKINADAMTGTVKQDAEGMAKAITDIAENMLAGRDKFMNITMENIEGEWRVNIPYSAYTKEKR